MHSSLILAAAASVSAAVVPRADFSGTAPLLPVTEFPQFKLWSLADLLALKDLLPINIDLGVSQAASRAAAPQHNTTDESELSVRAPTAAETAACKANPRIIVEWRRASAADRTGYVNAVKCLMNKPASGKFPPATNRYEDIVKLHQSYMPTVHNNAFFLPFHRYYLWTFEQLLRDECSLTGPMLWWDETLDAGRFASAPMFTSTYLGSLTNSGGRSVCVSNGAFAGLTCNIGPGTSNRAHCLSRALSESASSGTSATNVNACNPRTSYSDFESCLERGTHGNGHAAVGSVMNDVYASPSDPAFWLHHSFVDHSWAVWQSASSSRTTTINGVDSSRRALTLNTVVSVGGLRPDVTIGDILDTQSGKTIGSSKFCFKYDA